MLIQTPSIKSPCKKALLTSIWKTSHDFAAAMANKVCTVVILATGEYFSKIISFNLGKSFCNQPSLVTFNSSIGIVFDLENPLTANWFLVRRKINCNPCVVCLQRRYLFLHSSYPSRILCCFSICSRLLYFDDIQKETSELMRNCYNQQTSLSQNQH